MLITVDDREWCRLMRGSLVVNYLLSVYDLTHSGLLQLLVS
jgi:hypothetical protein